MGPVTLVADRNTTNSQQNHNNHNNNNNNNNRTTVAVTKEQQQQPSTNGVILNNHNHNNNHHLPVLTEPSQSTGLMVVGTAQDTLTAQSPPTLELLPKVVTREQECQVELLLQAVDAVDKTVAELAAVADPDWEKKAEDTVQALAITVQYFTRQLEDVSDCRIRKDFDKMKTEWLSVRSELENLRLRKASIEDALNQEREEHLQAIQSLREDLKHEEVEHSRLEQTIRDERRRADELQTRLQEREREQRIAIERLSVEHEVELNQARGLQVVQDQGALLAEVESLRTVLELRSRENAQLRSEAEFLRRELEEKETIKQRCESLEARCEDLKAQLQSKEDVERQLAHSNEGLMASIQQLSKQNKRYSQKIEELFWRLRQKNEVVSVLTNQLTPPSQRLSKSLGPENIDHPSVDSSSCSQISDEQQSCSIVKYMVEKGDSVSWTLDITESMDSSSGNCTKSPTTSSRRYHESNGVSRQGSLRLSMPRRTPPTPGRARSNSVSVAESTARAAAAVASASDEPIWNPVYKSTPVQRRRTNDQSWSLSNTVTEATSTSSSCSSVGGGNNVVCGSKTTMSSAKVLALEVSTTDEDEEEEEEIGQRPQEAGGEAMISEETSTSSSSEDESSVSSSDIP